MIHFEKFDILLDNRILFGENAAQGIAIQRFQVG